MSYRLNLGDPVPKTLHATAVEQFEDALAIVRDELAADPVNSVHEVRKDIKKTRSMLRLVRPGIPAKTYRQENRRLRDTARAISGARDADVMLETVDKLAERYAGRLPKRAFTTLRGRLAKQASGSDDVAGESLSGALEAARDRVERWVPEGSDAATIRAGAVRAYARGRRELAAAEADRSAERFHAWRKRVKDLWYHQRLLRGAWPAPLKALADESHRLSDLLGDDHDLAVLADLLADSPELTSDSATLDGDAVLALIAERRAELQDEALHLGRRVYADKPKAYGRRLERYLAGAGAE
jgi:CHAD domain-containing protein